MGLGNLAKFAVLMLVLHFGNTSSLFEMSKLNNVGLTPEFSVDSKSVCVGLCTGNVSAVSYSKYTNKCIVSYCGNLKVVHSGFWETYVCSNPITSCQLPTPALEWMLTDACGLANTGARNASSMKLVNFTVSGPVPLEPIYTIPAMIFGRAMSYSAGPNVTAYAETSSVTIDLRSQSLTIFGYSWFPVVFSQPLGGFYKISNGVFTPSTGPTIFSFTAGGLQYNLEFSSCSGDCSKTCLTYNPPLNVWLPYALVYNKNNQALLMYYNNSLVCTESIGTFSSASTSNVFLTLARPDRSYQGGSTFCLKVYLEALSPLELLRVAASCINGKLDFS